VLSLDTLSNHLPPLLLLFACLQAESVRMPGAFYSTRTARLNDNAHVIEAIDWDAQPLRIIGL